MVFDRDTSTFYDCDENCETVNNGDMEYGIPGDWDGNTELTGYVGAKFDDGIMLVQIRWFYRDGDGANRNDGGKFQASVDGVEWVDLATTENAPGGDFVMVDIDEQFQNTVYHYVRYVGPSGGYCNIAEIEIWGLPADVG